VFWDQPDVFLGRQRFFNQNGGGSGDSGQYWVRSEWLKSLVGIVFDKIFHCETQHKQLPTHFLRHHRGI
jgi:hypothetical protein